VACRSFRRAVLGYRSDGRSCPPQSWLAHAETDAARAGEAEACKVFYEEVAPNPTEVLYRCQYYLDDAVLRLHASCEHMLRAIEKRWPLRVDKKRERLLVSVLRAPQQSPLTEVRGAVATLLRRLRSSKAWNSCMKHRDDWVHNRLPAIAGFNPEILFDRTDFESAFPPQVRDLLRNAGYRVTGAVKRMSLETGPAGEVPRMTTRSAYVDLLGAYDSLVRVMD
jgi:hypothetical protein